MISVIQELIRERCCEFMAENRFLHNQFLIAMPTLTDPVFSHTVTYLCQHSEDGALGIVINRPSGMILGDVFAQMKIPVTSLETKQVDIYLGGPVQQERGFVIHSSTQKKWDSSINISPELSLTTSRDILEAIAAGQGPEHFLVALGYAGWGAGQLESEVSHNAWLNVPCTNEIIFKTPSSKRWNLAAKQIGVDINLLTTPAGHA